MNYFRNYSSEDVFNKPKSNRYSASSCYPNITYIEKTKEVGINGFYLFGPDDAVAGDIALMNTSNVIAFVKRKDYKKTITNVAGKRIWFPVGIVAVPKIFCEDNCIRLVSLSNITDGNYADVRYGTLATGDNYLSTYSLAFKSTPPSDTYSTIIEINDAGEAINDSNNGYMSSDSIREYGSQIISGGEDDLLINNSKRLSDPINYNYYIGINESEYSLNDAISSNNVHILSNPYFDPQNIFFNPANATSDLDGSGNSVSADSSSTAYYCGGYQGGYAALISNGGIVLGNWYMPSIGELAIMFAKCLEINASLITIGPEFAVPIGTDYSVEYEFNGHTYDEKNIYGFVLMSSTYAGNSRYWCLNTTNGYFLQLGNQNISTDLNYLRGRARAFCKLSS